MRPMSAPTPTSRFRRLRQTPALRALVQENELGVGDLIWPVFVRDGVGVCEPIASMPGVNRLSVDLVVEAAREAADLGIPAICLFPYTPVALRTEDCAEAWNPDNLTNRAIRAIKAAAPGIAVMTGTGTARRIASITINNAGAGYATAPTVTIAAATGTDPVAFRLQYVTAARDKAVIKAAATDAEVIWGDGPRLREFVEKADWRGFNQLAAGNAKRLADGVRRGDALLFLQSSQPRLLDGVPEIGRAHV